MLHGPSHYSAVGGSGLPEPMASRDVSRCSAADDGGLYGHLDLGDRRRPETFDSLGHGGYRGSPSGCSVSTMSMISEAPGAGPTSLVNCQVGAVVEAFSATTGCWYPAAVTQVLPGENSQEVLTVQFYINDEAKQKSVYRGDHQLAPLGAHTAGELPPGFEIKPSQSRPGQLVYQDLTTGMKYASAELAWTLHFERLQKRPPAGMETVCAMPSRSTAQGACAGAATPPLPPPLAVQGAPSPPKALTLAELQRRGPEAADAWALTAPQQGPHGEPGLAPHLDPTLGTAGKIALPCFGDALGSQAAYLRYEGKRAAAEAASAPASLAPLLAPVSSAAAAGYRIPAAAAPRRNSAPRRPVRAANPALHAWQEDAFSEWRN